MSWPPPWFFFELKCLPVVAERMWLRRRPFLEGRKASQGQRRSKRRGLAKREEAGCDTVLAIDKAGEEREEKHKQPGVLECGSTG